MKLMVEQSDNPDRPLVIGATGGSGTRVFARIARRLGVFMGTDRNHAEDAMAFVGFYDRWIDASSGGGLNPPVPSWDPSMIEEFRSCVEVHRAATEQHCEPWGWKNPRSLYLLPFFHRQYPGMKFLHVIRDGRDIACGSNQNQLEMYEAFWLGGEERTLPLPMRSLLLWSRVNSRVADFGEAELDTNYLRVRLEDLCRQPRPTVERLRAFLGVDDAGIDAAVGEVSRPESLGRWREGDREQFVSIPGRARAALDRFGYLAFGEVRTAAE